MWATWFSYAFFLGTGQTPKKYVSKNLDQIHQHFMKAGRGPICLEVSSSNQSRLHIPLCSTGPAGVGSGCSDSGWPARLFHAQYRCMHRMHLRIRWTSQIQFLKTKKRHLHALPRGISPLPNQGQLLPTLQKSAPLDPTHRFCLWKGIENS